MINNRTNYGHWLSTVIIATRLIFSLPVGLVACQAISIGIPTPEGSALSFETLEQEQYSGTGTMYELKNPGIIIVSSKDDVGSLKGLITDYYYIYLQTLNYDQFFIIGVFQGKKGYYSEHTIQVDGVYRSGSIVNVLVTIPELGPNEHPGAMETSPYHVVQVQKTDQWGEEITFNMVSDSHVVTSVVHMIP